MLKKVAFTMYPVTDMARARAFYEDVLGLAVGKHSDHGIWTEYDLPDGGCLALFRSTQLAPRGDGGALAFEVDDLDAEIAKLRAANVTFRAEMVHSPVCRMSVVLDSEGNSLILHQLKG
jgi:predicted enzyme related to lactoylglutathione lyase